MIRIAQQQKSQLNILCIGEIKSGKSLFLSRFTHQPQKIHEQNHYSQLIHKLYVRRIEGTVTYFHEVSEQFQVYLETKYDGIIFFVDLVSSIRAANKIIKWVQMYASCHDETSYNTPIKIIVTRTHAVSSKKIQKWRSILLRELVKVVNQDQIVFWGDMGRTSKQIKQFCVDLREGKGEGIKRNYRTEWKMFGFEETVKLLLQNLQYYFIFRGNSYVLASENPEEDNQSDIQSPKLKNSFQEETIGQETNQQQQQQLEQNQLKQKQNVNIEQTAI